MDTKVCFFDLKLSETSLLALSALFEYVCYGSTAIRKIVLLSVGRPSL